MREWTRTRAYSYRRQLKPSGFGFRRVRLAWPPGSAGPALRTWAGSRDASANQGDADPAEPLRNGDFGADVVELLLDRGCLVLVHAFLDRLRRGFHEVLCFLQAQAGDLANDLDHLDLVGAHFGQGHVELGLLLGRRGRAAGARTAARHRHRHRSRGGDTQFLLERLHELRELENADPLDVVDHL